MFSTSSLHNGGPAEPPTAARCCDCDAVFEVERFDSDTFLYSGGACDVSGAEHWGVEAVTGKSAASLAAPPAAAAAAAAAPRRLPRALFAVVAARRAARRWRAAAARVAVEVTGSWRGVVRVRPTATARDVLAAAGLAAGGRMLAAGRALDAGTPVSALPSPARVHVVGRRLSPGLNGVEAVAAAAAAAVAVVEAAAAPVVPPEAPEAPAKKRSGSKKRCGVCRKKLRLTDPACRCGLRFCADHRFADDHACEFDYASQDRAALEEANPQVVADRMSDRL